MRHSRPYDLEMGAHNKLPHYAVIGTPIDFYVWVNEHGTEVVMERASQGSSDWIRGSTAFSLYHDLKRKLKADKPEFVKLVKQLRGDYDREKTKGK